MMTRMRQSIFLRSSRNNQLRLNHDGIENRKVVVQLDYFMSNQFAGVAMANAKGLYKQAGIDLELLPKAPENAITMGINITKK